MIDPLDGAKELLVQNGELTVNIALVRDGMPVFGVVVVPALDLHYWGGPDFGAFRKAGNKTVPICVMRDEENDNAMLVVANKDHLSAETAKFMGKLGRHELVQACSSLKFCRIAEGAAHIYPRLGPTCEWDTSAAQAVPEGADGYVSSLDGLPPHYGKKEILNPHFVAPSTPQFILKQSC